METIVNYVKIMATKMKERTLDYPLYLEHVRHNELEILASKNCGCLSCGEVFSARLVKAWFTDDQGLSASCPHCGLGYVVGDASGYEVSPAQMKRLSVDHHRCDSEELLFQDYSEYCSSYFEGKIEANEKSERLYYQYLHALADDFHSPMATHALARLYARGGIAIPIDLDAAIDYYSRKPLCFDSSALFELAGVYQDRNARGDLKRAFETYAKSSALGSISASLRIGSFYLQGIYVKPDPDFGLNCLLSGFSELYLKAFTSPLALPELAALSFDIASCFRDGIGADKSSFRALRYFLLADYFVHLCDENGIDVPSFRHEAKKEIDRIAFEEKLDGASQEVVYDEDTFFDTFLEQYDSVCGKSILSIGQESDRLTLHMVSDSPLLILDIGNLALTHVNECHWAFPNVTAEFPTGESYPLRFERIEVDAHYVTSFIHEDPVYGDTVVLRLFFPDQDKDS